MYISYIFFIHSFGDGHLGCFHILTILNSVSVRIGMHLSFWVRIFSRYIPSVGSVDHMVTFSFLGNLHTVLRSGWSIYILTESPQCRRVSFSPHPLQCLSFVDFFMIAILISVRWYVMVVLMHIFLTINDVDYFFMCLLAIFAAAAKSLQSCSTLCDPIDCPLCAAHQAPLSLGFSRQEHWSGLPFPSSKHENEIQNEVAQSCLTRSDPMDHSLPGSSIHGISQARVLEWGAKAISMDMQFK